MIDNEEVVKKPNDLHSTSMQLDSQIENNTQHSLRQQSVQEKLSTESNKMVEEIAKKVVQT